MATTGHSQSFTGLIAVLEMLSLFVVGILGDEISQAFDIASVQLLLYTAIGLIILSVISYIRSMSLQAKIQSLASHNPFRRFIPKTMIGIFPFGVLLGLLLGATLPTYFPSSELGGMNPYENVGIFLGIIFGALFAMLVEGRLSAAMIFGYGISFATTILLVRPAENDIFWTYVGWTLFFIVVAIFLALMETLFKRFRNALFEQRID